jgi:hypothetical protein
MSLIPTTTLDAAEARSLTDELKRDAKLLWRKLLQLYEGGAHTALGYASWHTYCKAEFGFSESKSYRLLDAGRVATLIPDIGNESQASELAPLRSEPERMREAFAEARRRAGDRPPTIAQLRETVGAIRAVHTPPAPLDEDALHRQRLARVADELARLADDLDRLSAATLASALRGLARDVQAEAQS